MKKIISIAVVIVLALSMMMLTSCKSEFGMTENSEKRMVVNAENAAKDSFFAVGSLEAEEGDEIEIKADLEKGEIQIELFGMPAEQSIDEVPEIDGEPTIMAKLNGTASQTQTVSAGSFMLKATCLEKATGTVTIQVNPAP